MIRVKEHYEIYMYTFPNGKMYIGQTKRKMTERQGRDWKRYKRCRLLWKAIQKYGVENIKVDILFSGNLTPTEADALESKYIKQFKTNANRYRNPSYGYNLTDGGTGCVGWVPSDERRKVLQEQMYRLSQAHIGTKASEETRKKLSESHKGLRKGYKLSEETKRKIGFSNSLANISDENRKRRSKSKMKTVTAINKETGEVLEFENHMKAAEYFGVRDSAVSRWISGKRNPTNGYVFMDCPPTTTKR